MSMMITDPKSNAGMDVRRCWACRQVLPITMFARNRTGKDTRYRRRYICGPCSTRKAAERRASLSPEELEHQRALQRQRDARSARERSRRQHREDGIETLMAMLRQLQAWGVSIPEIARRAGVNPNTLYRWRKDANRRHINRETVDRVSRVYLAEVDRRRA